MTDQETKELFTVRLGENRDLVDAMLADQGLMTAAEETARLAATAFAGGGKLLIFGNGGSAADSNHIAAEFVGRYLTDRQPLPALSLAENQSSITAIGNDYGFDQVFARQIEAFGRPGDLAIGLSTSGNSENVISGLKCAERLGLRTVAMTGAEPGGTGDAAGLVVSIPTSVTPNVQHGHMLIAHIVCEWVERRLLAGGL